MKARNATGIAASMLFVFLAVGPAFGVTVEGFRNPYLAGMPFGTACCFGDSAPAQSPVGAIAVAGGQVLTFSATGAVTNGSAGTTDGPDGGEFFTSQQTGEPGTVSNNGIARMNAPVNALVGVFLDNNPPNTSGAPAGLDFSPSPPGLGRGFATLGPALKQPFFIGDGLTGTGTGAVQQFTVPAGATRLFLGTVDGIEWNNNTGGFDVTVNGASGGAAGPLFAAVLPLSRSVRTGVAATAFATILNSGSVAATGCTISLATGLPGPPGFLYQTTNSSNQLIGTPNTPATIPANGGQSFLIAFTPGAAFGPTNVAFNFFCSNAPAAAVVTGVNTLLLAASSSPTPDIIMLAVTPSNDGIVRITGGVASFAVALANVGAAGTVNISAETGGASQPINLNVCQTNAASQCINPTTPGPSVPITIGGGGTATVAVFVNASGAVPFSPGVNRIFVRATSGGTIFGATSVADMTQ